MKGYYEEILEEIEELIHNGSVQEALYTIEKELRMPYIPQETEEKLLELRRDLSSEIAAKAERKEESLETLLKWLRGTDTQQLNAAGMLGRRNLRDCLMEIRSFLIDDPCPEAAALIIEAIAEQGIRELFIYHNDGVEYEFYGDSVTPCAQSGGFRRALNFLEKWVANDNPSLFAMCRTMLIRKVYMFLPLSYEKEEAFDLALSVLEEVSDLYDEGLTYREVCAQNGIKTSTDLKS